MWAIEWLELAVRWFHVIAGIAWIGTSFYFIGVNYHVARPRDGEEDLEGEVWEVHGGAFYRVLKYRVAPGAIPEDLHWFKWEAYATLLSGSALLVLVYYMGAEAFLIEPGSGIGEWAAIGIGVAAIFGAKSVYEILCRSSLIDRPGLLAAAGLVLVTLLAWVLSEWLSGRATYLHVGAAIGTIMALNVFEVIIPAHHDLVNAVEAGEEPDSARGREAANRSLHNNYLTLPVVFLMISNHYPITYGHPHGWLILGAIVAIGGWIRHGFNLHHRGRGWTWVAVTAGIAAIALVVLAGSSARGGTVDADVGAVSFDEARGVIARRCVTCHSANPAYPGFEAPPAGVSLDTPEQIRAWRDRIHATVVESRIMPLGNLTDMTEEERARVGAWARSEE